MSQRTTKAHLDRLVLRIGKLTGIPVGYEQAKKESASHYLHLDHNQSYGGYRLELIKVDGMSSNGPFGFNGMEARQKAGAMYTSLFYLLNGIEYGMQQGVKMQQALIPEEMES